jgi:hypothetical protein
MQDYIPVNQKAVPVDKMKRRGFELLERSAVKVARSVLRKVALGDGACLSDYELVLVC